MINDAVAATDVAVIVGDRMFTPEGYQEMLRQRREKLHQVFVNLRDEWVVHRANSGVEERWRRANELYYGDQDEEVNRFVETLKVGPRVNKASTPNRSRVVVNIVRPKCDQATARLAEILLPVDDRNWAIKPTPVPELANYQGDERETFDPETGEPTGLTADQEAKIIMEDARERAKRMQDLIDDNLTECNMNGEARKLLEYGVRLGTGVLKGPYPTYHEKKSWTTDRKSGVSQLTFISEIKPASEALDPWNVFFDPACGRNHQMGRGVIERVPNVTPKELRRLAKMDGYDPDAIREVLTEGPKRVRVAEKRSVREPVPDGSFEMWIYHGEIDAEDMSALSSGINGDPLTDVEFGVIVIVNDRVIGTMRSWVVDGSLPYDVWNWREADDSPYGYGLPDELAHQQRVINGAWRQVMDNARFSMGGQIVMRKGSVVPADSDWSMSPGKLWYAKDDLDDVRKAFTVFEFASHVEELMTLVNAAMQLADSETGMPQMMGGERGSAPETVGGMVLLYNNANAVLRLRVKRYDDEVTRPHISRYYDFHMVNSDDDAIKGDYEIDARGSSALVERDMQNQAMINLAAITNNPRYVPHLKERAEIEAILRAFKIDPEELMKTEEEVQREMEAAAQQGMPEDPRIVAAQINAEAKMAEIQDRKEARDLEARITAMEHELKRAGLHVDMERRVLEHQDNRINAQLQREIAIAKMLQDGELSREERESRERLDKIKIADGRERFNAEMYVKTTQGSGI